MQTAATPSLLTIPETAALLRVHRATLYRAVARGELDARRLGANGPLRMSAVEGYARPARTDEEPRL